MKIQLGKSYKNRKGGTVGPMEVNRDSYRSTHPFKFGNLSYSEGGKLNLYYEDTEEDLIEEIHLDDAPTETAMNVSKTGGLRDNKNKPRVSLVPAELEEAVAEVIFKSSSEGGGKYPMHNWRKGLPWSEVAESAIRHLKKFAQKGEDFDEESGLHHLAHAATNVAFLLEYLKTHPELDDRYKKDTE